MLRRINPVLPELLAGIVLYGILLQVTVMWFVEDKQQYTMGLWIGAVLAMGMAVNMAIVILDAADMMAARGTAVRTGLWSLLRYLVVIGAFVAVWYFKAGSLLAMFLGVMGLKVSAYMQPFLHKFILRMQKKSAKRGDGSTDKI